MKYHPFSGKAHARVDELHKQVDELEKELKTQEKEKDVLNARASEAEKKVKELNSKLEDRYIMTSYFEKYESLDDTNFQEFISHGLPFGSCESLQSNPDLLRLSVPQRLLIGEGSHRHLSSSIKFHIEPESVSQLSSHFCEVLIIERLPSGVFADPFELQHLLERGVFTNVVVFGDTNLELPSVLSNRSAIEVHVDLGSNMLLGHKKELDVNIQLPIHARYPPLDESGYSTVKFGTPDIFLHCSIEGKSRNQRCLFIPTIDGANTNAKPVFWRIPSGRTAHARIVFVLTFISAFISTTLLIVLTSIYHSNTGNSKNGKTLLRSYNFSVDHICLTLSVL